VNIIELGYYTPLGDYSIYDHAWYAISRANETDGGAVNHIYDKVSVAITEINKVTSQYQKIFHSKTS